MAGADGAVARVVATCGTGRCGCNIRYPCCNCPDSANSDASRTASSGVATQVQLAVSQLLRVRAAGGDGAVASGVAAGATGAAHRGRPTVRHGDARRCGCNIRYPCCNCRCAAYCDAARTASITASSNGAVANGVAASGGAGRCGCNIRYPCCNCLT